MQEGHSRLSLKVAHFEKTPQNGYEVLVYDNSTLHKGHFQLNFGTFASVLALIVVSLATWR
eukprot:1677070-Amphidinium_carterae.1